MPLKTVFMSLFGKVYTPLAGRFSISGGSSADFSVVDPYRMMLTDGRFRRKVTQPFVHASRAQVNIIATRCNGSLLTTEKAIDEPDRLIHEWAL